MQQALSVRALILLEFSLFLSISPFGPGGTHLHINIIVGRGYLYSTRRVTQTSVNMVDVVEKENVVSLGKTNIETSLSTDIINERLNRRHISLTHDVPIDEDTNKLTISI